MFISWKKNALISGNVEQPEDGLGLGAARLRSSPVCRQHLPRMPATWPQCPWWPGVWVAFTGAFSLELPFRLFLAFDSNYIKKDH